MLPKGPISEKAIGAVIISVSNGTKNTFTLFGEILFANFST